MVTTPAQGNPGPARARVFRAKTCEWCGTDFTPTSGRAARCEACRALTAAEAGRCTECGSPVSGAALWGQEWGGACDRAEAIAARVMAGLRSKLND